MNDDGVMTALNVSGPATSLANTAGTYMATASGVVRLSVPEEMVNVTAAPITVPPPGSRACNMTKPMPLAGA